MLVLFLACVPLFFLWRPFTRHNPWPRRFLGGITRIAGVKVRVSGQTPGPGAFLLANHVSWIDIPAIAGLTGSAFVAHDGLSSHPVLHWLCRMNDTVFVARHDRKSVALQVEQVREAIRDTGALTIFPEGTTADGTCLLPFKSSLLSALDPVPEGIDVQPVWLDYGNDVPGIAWVGDEPGLDNFLRILARSRPVALTVHFLEPLAGDAIANRKTMAAATQRAVAGAMANRQGTGEWA
ncbi:MAG: 1-acyl-sn-glycerol-3-phosphate acyltransferase [Novosphingobium sp.]|nr:1-acyl-sn-glycerol-3-phosphate acyltransferase [Novosphingobium sp.]